MRISVGCCTLSIGVLVSAAQGFEVRSAGDSKVADTGRDNIRCSHIDCANASADNHVYSQANAALLSFLSAQTGNELSKRTFVGSACPEIWSEVAADLRRAFHGCSRQASTAIRFAFHDAGQCPIRGTSYPKLTNDLTRRILKPDNAIWRG